MTCCAADFNKSGAEHPDSQTSEPPLYCEAQGGQDCRLNQRLLPTLYCICSCLSSSSTPTPEPDSECTGRDRLPVQLLPTCWLADLAERSLHWCEPGIIFH